MGWKIVRDHNETWARAHGISGQWRTCVSPVASLTKKLLEEAGEWAEDGDPAELYDLLDVLDRLISLADMDGAGRQAHAAKLHEMGAFDRLTEWCPVPPGKDT